MATVPMIAPDGSIGDVPAARAHEAANSGFKLGAELSTPDGSKTGVVPYDRVHEAIAAGFMLKPPDVPRPNVNVEEQAGPTESRGDAGKLTGLPGVNPHRPTITEGLSDAALAGSALLGPTLPTLAKKAAPFAIPAAASYAINKARQLPVIGPVIDKIPFAEALPWLMMGKVKEGEGGTSQVERDATAGNKPFAGEEMPETPSPTPKTAPIERDATRQNKPYAGDYEPWKPRPSTVTTPEATVSGEPIQAKAAPVNNAKSTSGGQIYRDATLNKRNIPEFAGEDVPDEPIKVTPTPSSPSQSPGGGLPFAQRTITPSTRNIRENSNLVRQAEAVKPSGGYGSPDSIENRGVNQMWSQDLEQHGEAAEDEMRKEFAAGSTSGVTKQDLTGAPDKPVVYTKTKSASGKGPIKTVKVSGSTASDDMTGVLQQMLDNVRKGKSIKQ